MQRWLRNALSYTCGLLALAFLLECLFRLLPVPMGLYRTEQYQRWPLQNYEPHHTYASSMSWEMRHARIGTSNNYGHVAPFDYQRGTGPVIVVGDSFVESQMNRYQDTLQGQLGDLLKLRDAVYGLGANGLSISDYLAVSGLAAAEFAPRAAVFLVIDGDVSESLLRQIGHYNFAVKNGAVELQYWPLYGDTFAKTLRRVIGDFALYRYVQMNLRFDPGRLIQRLIDAPAAHASAAVAAPRAPLPAETAAVDHFLNQLAPTLKMAPACVVLLFHSDTYAIYDPAAANALKDAPMLKEYFQDHARAQGYRVVDLEQRFRADYQMHGQRLDFWPLDRHLNGRGHGVAAQAAYDALYANGGGMQCRPAGTEGTMSAFRSSAAARQ